MPCPNCGSHELWDDNLAWGCYDCEFFSTGDICNRGDTSLDRFNEGTFTPLAERKNYRKERT